MIVSFKNQGLERFYLTGNTAGLAQKVTRQLLRIYLACLDSVYVEEDLHLPKTSLQFDGELWQWRTSCGIFYFKMEQLQVLELDFVVEEMDV